MPIDPVLISDAASLMAWENTSRQMLAPPPPTWETGLKLPVLAGRDFGNLRNEPVNERTLPLTL